MHYHFSFPCAVLSNSLSNSHNSETHNSFYAYTTFRKRECRVATYTWFHARDEAVPKFPLDSKVCSHSGRIDSQKYSESSILCTLCLFLYGDGIRMQFWMSRKQEKRRLQRKRGRTGGCPSELRLYRRRGATSGGRWEERWKSGIFIRRLSRSGQ